MPRSSRPRDKRRAERETPACPLPGRAGVLVVGGGASGLIAALAAARAGAEGVCVLEAGPRPGRSVLASGNGRCNLTNEALGARWVPGGATPFLAGPGAAEVGREPGPAWDQYNDPAFVRAAMGDDPLSEVLGLFRGLGVLCLPDEEGRVFPASRCASSVLGPLLAELDARGVTLARGAQVQDVAATPEGDWDVALADGRRVRAPRVVWAAGGGSADALARACGARVEPSRPVLAPLACAGGAQGLDGVRAACVASLMRPDAGGRTLVARERGEVLFRPYGVSGIAVFDLSRHARAGDVLSLDVTPGASQGQARAGELAELVEARLAAARTRPDAGAARLSALDGACNPKLGRHVMARLAGADGMRDVRAEDVLHALSHMELEVTGVADAAHAQVTRGGLSTAEVSPATMGLLRAPGLFACGEALDVDAACGGFNLSWAWVSGTRAGRAAAGAI